MYTYQHLWPSGDQAKYWLRVLFFPAHCAEEGSAETEEGSVETRETEAQSVLCVGSVSVFTALACFSFGSSGAEEGL